MTIKDHIEVTIQAPSGGPTHARFRMECSAGHMHTFVADLPFDRDGWTCDRLSPGSNTCGQPGIVHASALIKSWPCATTDAIEAAIISEFPAVYSVKARAVDSALVFVDIEARDRGAVSLEEIRAWAKLYVVPVCIEVVVHWKPGP